MDEIEDAGMLDAIEDNEEDEETEEAEDTEDTEEVSEEIDVTDDEDEEITAPVLEELLCMAVPSFNAPSTVLDFSMTVGS